MNSSKHKTLTVTAIILLIIVTVIYTFYDPIEPWFPRCIFKQLTGLECPGCGSQRALHALLSGHPIEALRYNFLPFLLVPYAVLLIVSSHFENRLPRLYRTIHSSTSIYAILTIIVGWWILRNLISLYC